MRVVLEIGPKGRKVVAGAIDWPGLDRSAGTEEKALDRLAAYLPRYAAVAERTGLAQTFAAAADELEVVERTPGQSSTDFWGVAHVPSQTEAEEVLTDEQLERRLTLLQAAWAFFEASAGEGPAELRPGSRGGGRSLMEIVRHVAYSEQHLWWPKVEVRTAVERLWDPATLAADRQAYLEAIRAYHVASKPARRWPLAFLIRRTAQHALDHAWEIEDRDPGRA
ncbi:MAG TPA: hypothetical protein VFW92_01475 [Candidatus Limnocylindrales bacterium]|nr:hypothetical protein [Candidatus Limnocylindrales bacterium]